MAAGRRRVGTPNSIRSALSILIQMHECGQLSAASPEASFPSQFG